MSATLKLFCRPLGDRHISLLRHAMLIVAFCLSAASTAARAQAPEVSLPTATEIAQSGERNGSIYRNRLLGFTMSIPGEWTFASDEMNRSILAEGNKKIKANETAERQKQFDLSVVKTAVLFSLSKHEMSDVRNLGYLTAGFERTPSGVAARAYSDYNKQLVISKMTAARLLKDTYPLQVSGKEMFAFYIESVTNGVKISQTYHVLAHRAGMLFFIITWRDGGDEERKTLQRVITSTKFDS